MYRPEVLIELYPLIIGKANKIGMTADSKELQIGHHDIFQPAPSLPALLEKKINSEMYILSTKLMGLSISQS